jgi:hypothetical protein
MDISKVDRIIQYALAVAGDQDFCDRELGPIHLIKYVYLADLAYTERNKGKTFTGINWRFHHFGPWSLDVLNRVEPACTAIRAEKKSIPSQHDDKDFTRWSVQDDSLREAIASDLPITITSAVQWAVRKFGSDTYSLLNYVYLTKPILTAAPGESLDFSPVEEDSFIEPKKEVKELSKKQEKQKEAKFKETQRKIQEKLALRRKRSKGKISVRPPRYDETFFEGCRWLDSLAGPETRDLEGEAHFTPDIWKSRSRFDPDVP